MTSNSKISALIITLSRVWSGHKHSTSGNHHLDMLDLAQWLNQSLLSFQKRLAFSGLLFFILLRKSRYVLTLLSFLLTLQYVWINGGRTPWTWLSQGYARGSFFPGESVFLSLFLFFYSSGEIGMIVVCLFQTHLLIIHHWNLQSRIWTLQWVLPQRW